MNKNKKKTSVYSIIYSVVSTLLTCSVCIALLFTFIFRTVTVDGNSMNPGLNDGDKIIISNFLYSPDYGDIIIISRDASDKNSLIKRVIALSGDTVDINFDTHLITVNGKVLTEKYLVTEPISRKGDIEFPVTVPENCVFVLGDNRNNSLDSRFSEIGFIDMGDIVGRTVVRISPFGKFVIK